MKTNTYGFVLIFALLVIIIASSLLTGLLFSANTSLSITSNSLKAARAESFAKIGLSRFQTIAHQSYAFYLSHWEDYNLTSEQLQKLKCGTANLLSLGLDMDRLRDGPWSDRVNDNTRTIDILVNQPFEEHETLPDGMQGGYVVTLSNEGKTLESKGYLGESFAGGTARSRATVSFSEANNSSPYQNAIFAGGEQGKVLGSIAIYGSVHLIGRPLDNIALDITKEGGIYNNYYGRKDQASDISTDVEALTNISTSAPPDLCTQLKIKYGNVNRDSISPIGWNDDENNNSIIFNIAAIYLDAQLLGNPPYTRKDKSSYSDTIDTSMPEIPNNYPNDVGNAVYIANCIDFTDDISDGTFDLSSADVGDNCFSSNSFIALVDSTTTCAGITNDFLSTSFTVNLIPDLVAVVQSYDNNSTGKLLCINGTVNTGSFNLTLNNINYQGQGTFRVGIGAGNASNGAIEADINISGSVTPVNRDFPRESALGLVSNHNINIIGSTNESHAFIAFAEDTITISEQVIIAGSLIAGTFQVAKVPKVAYVPGVFQVAANQLGLPQSSDLASSTKLGVVAYERQ